MPNEVPLNETLPPGLFAEPFALRILSVSPGAYRVKRRLEQARLLLLEHPVREVADALGYSDPLTFSAQFKAHFGLSPQHFQARESIGGRPSA